MSQIKVDLDSLEELYVALLACAGELVNAQFSVGAGQIPASWQTAVTNHNVGDAINGAWGYEGQMGANLGQVLQTYSGSLQDAGKSVENIATVLKAAIKHYAQADADVASGARSLGGMS